MGSGCRWVRLRIVVVRLEWARGGGWYAEFGHELCSVNRFTISMNDASMLQLFDVLLVSSYAHCFCGI